MKNLFIDIRKSDEVYANRFAPSSEYSVYNIPMNMIRFNAETILKHLDYVDEIYLVCQTTARSQFIKDKYFKQHDRIKVHPKLQFSNLSHGSNTVVLGHEPVHIRIVGTNSFNFYSVMRIIQTIMGLVMLAIGLSFYLQIRNAKVKRFNLPLIVLVLFGSMALYNGLTSTCSISTLLEDYLN